MDEGIEHDGFTGRRNTENCLRGIRGNINAALSKNPLQSSKTRELLRDIAECWILRQRSPRFGDAEKNHLRRQDNMESMANEGDAVFMGSASGVVLWWGLSF